MSAKYFINFEPATLVELLRHRSAIQSDHVAFTFLTEGETEAQHLSYSDLDRRARAIAASLASSGVAGERVLILAPPGLDYIAAFFGCLYAGAVAVPLYPPRLNRSMERLRAVIRDAQPKAALTIGQILSRLAPLLAQPTEAAGVRWLAVDAIAAEADSDWQLPALNGDSLALLQYTSGSTALPKGVMVSHANLLHNERMIQTAFAQSASSVIVSWLPLYHDMGLIGGMLQPLYLGARCILMSPVAFLQQPLRWLQAISDYRATTSGGPSFAYELCVRKTTPEQRELLDLSSWTVAFNGSEPVRAEVLDRFAEAFGPSGFRKSSFYPCYGLAEATLLVSAKADRNEPVLTKLRADGLERHRAIAATDEDRETRTLVSCGQVAPSQRVLIVDPETCIERPAGQIGEIWVAGPSVAHGYWNRIEATTQTFGARLADTGAGPFLRTGDLGFSGEEGLFITGRCKDLIIIRGLNHYPQDIELTVERSHPALRLGCGAAFSVEVDGDERLVVVQEIDRHAPPQTGDIFAAIREAVALNHNLQLHAIVLIKHGTMAKTSSGKIQRQACRAAYVGNRLERYAEWQTDLTQVCEPSSADFDSGDWSLDTLQMWLTSQIAGRLNIAAHELDPDHPIIQYGLDSLVAIEIMHAIDSTLGITIPLSSLFQNASIAQLASHCAIQLQATSHRTGVIPESRASSPSVTLPSLSYGQRAMWFLQQMNPADSAYHIVSALKIGPHLDAEALRRAMQSLVNRHAALRTTFGQTDGEPVQHIAEKAELDFEFIEAEAFDSANLDRMLAERARRPFHLAAGPLLRVSLFRQSDNQHILLLVIHHIIADLWSLAVLARELPLFYRAETEGGSAARADLPLQYIDYASWQNQIMAGDEGDRLWAYWRAQLDGELPALNLPTDRPRSAAISNKGAAHSFELGAELTHNLKQLSRSHRATLYMTLLAAYQMLLHRYTGQPDVLVGTPTTGRTRPEFAPLIGYFVNPVVMRSRLAEDPAFSDFLAATRQTALAAFDHQDYPFPLLVEKLQPQREAGRSPIFQTLFVFESAPQSGDAGLAALALGSAGTRVGLGDFVLESMPLAEPAAQFELTLTLAKSDDRLLASAQYRTGLFDAATIARISTHFVNLLSALANDAKLRISQIDMLTTAERRQLLDDWNATAAPYAHDGLIHAEFERQARQTPQAIAIVHGHQQITYAELDSEANRVACQLQNMGIVPESLVGVCMDRSIKMIAALLGVLKAGAAYVPLDPQYPAERIAYIMQDAAAAVLLTEDRLHETAVGFDGAVIRLDRAWPPLENRTVTNPQRSVISDNLAYVIYTSGSTGRPKGVAIAHRSAVALIDWARRQFSAEEMAAVLASTSICFDLSIFEIFVTLSTGGKIILADNALDLPSLPAAADVTLINTVPSALAELVRADALGANLRTVNLAGEALRLDLVEQLYERGNIEKVYNLYGPSEDTTYSTWELVDKQERRPPCIGRPIANSQVYLLDERLDLVPVGVAGELYVAGDGLARGYLHRPEMTADRFIPNPFSAQPGARLYRTGDLARYLADGRIDFLGRIDNQVKIRGYRIELGEIEAVLRKHPQVREAVITVWEPQDGDRRLTAYVVAAGDGPLAGDELRQFLKQSLPDYMVPSSFTILDALPLTPNGKLDRCGLPPPNAPSAESQAEYIAPRNVIEQTIYAIWREVLATGDIGIHTNFFEAGGHSLLAAQVASRVRNAFAVELPLRHIFEAQTIAGLAEFIEPMIGSRRQTAPQPIRRLPRVARRVRIPSIPDAAEATVQTINPHFAK